MEEPPAAVGGPDEASAPLSSAGDQVSPPGSRIITESFLVRACLATHPNVQKKNETAEHLLARMTSINLNNKQLTRIEGMDDCTSLQVLYLIDNKIAALENLGFGFCLTHLYLQNNELTVVEGLQPCRALTHLYLNGNRITEVRDLRGPLALRELHLSHQRLSPGSGGLTFTHDSLEAVAGSLEVLDIAETGTVALEPLAALGRLKSLEASDNGVARFEEVAALLAGCRQLKTLSLNANPVLAGTARFHEETIVLSDSLTTLNGRPVVPQQRTFIRSLNQRRAPSGASGHLTASSAAGGPRGGAVGVGVSGCRVGSSVTPLGTVSRTLGGQPRSAQPSLPPPRPAPEARRGLPTRPFPAGAIKGAGTRGGAGTRHAAGSPAPTAETFGMAVVALSGLFKKWEDGGEMFQRAANHYKVEQLFSDAARCFEQAAEAFSHTKNHQNEIPRMWYEASNAHRKDSLVDAERCLKRAIDFHLSEGNPKAAARFLRDAGRIALEAGDPASALIHFERAGQLAQGEEQNALALECREQHALLVSSHQKDFAQARFSICQLAMTNALTEGLVRRHLLRASCCLLCNKDPVAVHAAMERYTSIYDKFSRTREYDLVMSCLEAIERTDPTILATAVLLYDRVTPNRDPWLTEMLLQVRRDIEGAIQDEENPA
ncbi:putative Protein phosphatase 1 regulatory subunit 42 [Paratrimastix pyriformis]|uniref:Uncharacterized protein n=1 Tax=Paratrimastix pyriformis TaxID=342808 RepID=A0ABQ8U9L5_9EUKA|nr:putative Protein phosphatase 1 regulatory subunit 42 [Paratrimastix pyriformis]